MMGIGTGRAVMDDGRQGQSGADVSAVLGLGASHSLKRVNRWWIAGSVAVLLLIVGAVRFFSGPPGPEYRLGEVSKGGIVATVTATGTLQPVNTVDLGPVSPPARCWRSWTPTYSKPRCCSRVPH